MTTQFPHRVFPLPNNVSGRDYTHAAISCRVPERRKDPRTEAPGSVSVAGTSYVLCSLYSVYRGVDRGPGRDLRSMRLGQMVQSRSSFLFPLLLWKEQLLCCMKHRTEYVLLYRIHKCIIRPGVRQRQFPDLNQNLLNHGSVISGLITSLE